MMAVINTNLLSLTTQNNLNKSQSSLGTAIERLSSGLRINSAKDDAAGQAIANRMTAQIKGMTQAARNANDGISMAQTAEGSLNEINNNLQRVRELAVQASNGTNSTSDLASLQDEVTARLAEIDRVAGKTDFNGIKLLDGSAGASGVVKIQVGANDQDTIDLDLSGAKADSTTLAVKSIDLKSMKSTDLATIDAAIAKVDKARSGLGAVQNRFTSAINNLNNTSNNLSAAQSRIQDADYATEVSNMSRAQILQQAGTSVLSQANQVPQTVLSLLR
ncbi:flagellin [Enterobacter sp. BT855]|nr:flagellin [Enterobacter sp. FL1277]MCR1309276.1 flagellin [Enterobacter sp. BT1271]MCR1314054.1 flagellin [Enterobacter sp. BT855]MCR1325250.1 flagellin [Enterobacter sp. BT1268]MCR1328329.1 flagellin [Enterobacter sp. BT1131]MCR1333688.1 flagellin [Enterobacter sp. BT4]MCR1338718.1 flagellin [Enterobacter sp. BT223]UOY72964.1 flagellin FliC [Enterobacter ludwigii]